MASNAMQSTRRERLTPTTLLPVLSTSLNVGMALGGYITTVPFGDPTYPGPAIALWFKGFFRPGFIGVTTLGAITFGSGVRAWWSHRNKTQQKQGNSGVVSRWALAGLVFTAIHFGFGNQVLSIMDKILSDPEAAQPEMARWMAMHVPWYVTESASRRVYCLSQGPPLTGSRLGLQVYRQVPVVGAEIRLLKLLPAPSQTDAIEVVLFVQKPDSPTLQYEALSYRWSDPNDRCRITVNGMHFMITRTLHSALREFRSIRRERLLWADGICIDQSNVLERNHQVSLMNEIFSAATFVRVYVGEAADETYRAMQLIYDCGKLSSKEDVKDRILQDETGSKALTELLSRPYWQRMWIFQEIVLGRAVVIYCGSFQAPWHGLYSIDEASGDGRLWFENQIRQGWVFNLRKALFRISQFCIDRSQARYPTNVLQPTRALQATDPRDKLFALLGVSDFGSTLTADYAKSTRDVYVDFASRFMKQENDLALLLTAGLCQMQNGPDIELPSWTPDFRGVRGVDIRFLAASYLDSFQAAGNWPPSFSFTEDGQMLSTAVIVDQIDKSVPLYKSDTGRASILSTVGSRQVDGAWQNLHIHLFKTMVFYDRDFEVAEGDSGIIRQRKQERLRRLVLGFAHDWATISSGQFKTSELEERVVGFLASFSVPDSDSFHHEYQTLLHQDQESLHWYRQEYLSRWYIGQGSEALRHGDLVAILYGSYMLPYIKTVGEALLVIHLFKAPLQPPLVSASKSRLERFIKAALVLPSSSLVSARLIHGTRSRTRIHARSSKAIAKKAPAVNDTRGYRSPCRKRSASTPQNREALPDPDLDSWPRVAERTEGAETIGWRVSLHDATAVSLSAARKANIEVSTAQAKIVRIPLNQHNSVKRVSNSRYSCPTPLSLAKLKRQTTSRSCDMPEAFRALTYLRVLASSSLESQPELMRIFDRELGCALEDLSREGQRNRNLASQVVAAKNEVKSQSLIISGLVRERSSIQLAAEDDVSGVKHAAHH
ncbi:hypothetical protein NM208_g5360 [Fusarium decemcellulare]|uniref:Uncharacterized protein n=1 Tax=Fusarium decemcellulare TaxID=57161 RepID=A0ACC1SHC6_9HYPO|nr:hypothetical protein NM208_g5360 [Fusarium decemcellulare]